MPFLAGFVTPQDYGATGNGVTDDTTAVQAAITAVQAAGGTIFIPAGTYLLSSVITCTGTVNLIGAGPGVSILHQSSTSANGITYNAASNLTGVSVSGLSLTGPGSGSGVGILLEGNGGSGNVNGAVVANIAVSGFGSHGVSVINATGCTFESIFASSLGGNALLLTGGSSNAVTAISGGTISVTGTAISGAVLRVNTAASLGDNGVGEIQGANATTVPSTNPTGGAVAYVRNGSWWSRDPNGTISPMVSPSEVSASPTGALGETIPRFAVNSVTQAIGATTGTVYMTGLWLPAGLTITNVNWVTGSTAANTPTHWWLGISDNGGVQRGHTADQTSGAIAANTLISKALASTYTTTYTGLYYVLVSVTATANPTASGVAAPSNMNVTSPLLAGVSPSAAQSTPGTDGTTTYTVPSAAGGIPYAYLT